MSPSAPHLERNAAGLLSGAEAAASPGRFGRHAVNPAVVRSGLWNVNHLDDGYRPEALDLLEAYVTAVPERSAGQ